MIKLIHIVFIFFPLVGFSQVDTIAHIYTFGGTNNDNAEEIEGTTDGGYIVIGSTSSNSWGNTDAYLLKVDSACNYQWSQAIGGANNDWGYSIKQTFDKGFIIAATSNSYGSGGYDAVLTKRDSLGNYVWRKVYGGQDWDFAYSVVQTYDSGYVFCGETYSNSNGFSDVFIVKTNPSGDTLWTRTMGGSLIDKGKAVIETSDSNIVVVGITNTIADSTEVYVIKFSSNGILLWDSIYGNGLYENANAIIETANGDYVIAGATTSFSPAGDKDFYLIRTNSNGGIIWENYFGNPAIPKDDEIFDIYEEINGDLVNVGTTEAAGGGMEDATLFFITSIGNWLGIGPTFGSSNNEGFKSFTLGTNGDYCMAGYTTSFGNGIEDVLIVRLDTVYNGQDTNTTNFMDLIPLKVTEVVANSKLKIYPNPVENFVNIMVYEFDYAITYRFELTDIQGRIILSRDLFESDSRIKIENVKKGIYIYSITNKSGLLENGKLIIH